MDDQLYLIFTNPRTAQVDGKQEIHFKPIRKSLPFSVPESLDFSRSFFIVNGEMSAKYYFAGKQRFVSFDEPVNELTFYFLDDRNLIGDDPSFEQSAWENRLADCNRSDERSIEDVGIRASRTSEHVDGKSALQLEAREHQACVSTNISSVTKDVLYHLSFWVKRTNEGLFPQWTIIERSADSEHRRSRDLDIPVGQWTHVDEDILLDSETTNFDLLLEMPGDLGGKRNVVLFDDIRLTAQVRIGTETVDVNEAQKHDPIPVMLSAGEHVIRSTNEIKDAFVNIDAMDPSFEQTAWKESLRDCNRADDRDLDTVGIDAVRSEDSTDGQFSLHLTAKEHIACVSERVESVQAGHQYLLSFDHKSVTSKKSARVRIAFQSEIVPPQEELLPRRKDWTTHQIPINIPQGVESIDVILMTEGGGAVMQGNLFDHLRLQKISYQQDQNLFVVTSSETRGG